MSLGHDPLPEPLLALQLNRNATPGVFGSLGRAWSQIQKASTFRALDSFSYQPMPFDNFDHGSYEPLVQARPRDMFSSLSARLARKSAHPAAASLGSNI